LANKLLESGPLVSVIIPNYNYGKYLGQAIESVLDQTYKNVELIVVDNESTDNSIEVVTRFLDVVTLIQKSHGGVSSARNLGLSNAKGEYICFLDSDDTWNPDKLESQIEIARTSQAGVVYSGVAVCDAELSKIEELFPEFEGDCSSLFFRYPTKAIILLGCSNAMIRKEIVVKAGDFKSHLHISADWDFFRRICRITSVAFVAKTQVNYRRHNQNMSSRSVEKYYSDNELAILDCINENRAETTKISSELGLFLFWSRFQWQAIKSLLKSKCFSQAVKRFFRTFHFFNPKLQTWFKQRKIDSTPDYL
jgi:glycosyltransferase involved in cell wall biosynthesis